MYKCALCDGSGKSKFVDMSKVPENTSMVMCDETWNLYEEEETCIDCHGFRETIFDEHSIQTKSVSIRLLSN